MKKSLSIIVIIAAVAVVGALMMRSGEDTPPVNGGNDTDSLTFQSDEYDVSFDYPNTYFEIVTRGGLEEGIVMVVGLLEDTEENRALVRGELPGRDGPPTITMVILENKDSLELEEFIKSSHFLNYRLSDKNFVSSTLGGEPALRYSATGLYENKNAVVAKGDYIYMFTGFYLTPEDQILKDFEKLVDTVRFE